MKWLKRAKTQAVFLLFFIFCHSLPAQNTFHFSPNCLEAQEYISVLKLDKAKELLKKEKAANPSNCAVDYLENYIDFYYLITNQDGAELKRLEVNKDQRIDRIRKVTAQSPYRLYAQAEINLQWAFSRVFQEEFLSAAMEFRSAYQLLEENSKKFPAFTPNNKDMGMLKSMLGTIPENFKWVLNIVGMKGNLSEGMNMLRSYVEQTSFAKEELLEKQSGEYYYTFLQLNFGDKQECWKFCEKVTADYQQNLLSCYLRGFTGIKTGHNDDALTALLNKPKGADYVSFPILDYLTGVALLNKLDDDAAIYLKKYVSFSKGKNLVKDAYKRLAWYSLIHHDSVHFVTYKNMVKKYGAAISDEDKSALKEMESTTPIDMTLLKARLLFDGGYYTQAEEVLEQRKPGSYPLLNHRIEYSYRYGRIMQEQKKYLKAIEHYQEVITLSENANLYFAPNSCLQLGYIYECLGNKSMAKTYYEKALTYKNYEYKFGITQKAKAALNRLGD